MSVVLTKSKSFVNVVFNEGPLPKMDAFFNVGLGNFKKNFDIKITFKIDKKLSKSFLKNPPIWRYMTSDFCIKYYFALRHKLYTLGFFWMIVLTILMGEKTKTYHLRPRPKTFFAFTHTFRIAPLSSGEILLQ